MKSSIKLALAVTAITLGFMSAFPTVSTARPILTRSECNLVGGKWLPLTFLNYDTDARLYGFSCTFTLPNGDTQTFSYHPAERNKL
jgi:hypothetical protein